ncbi:MAG TPA: hypothetical protein VGC12_07280, partial [Methyloradius sp.]
MVSFSVGTGAGVFTLSESVEHGGFLFLLSQGITVSSGATIAPHAEMTTLEAIASVMAKILF